MIPCVQTTNHMGTSAQKCGETTRAQGFSGFPPGSRTGGCVWGGALYGTNLNGCMFTFRRDCEKKNPVERYTCMQLIIPARTKVSMQQQRVFLIPLCPKNSPYQRKGHIEAKACTPRSPLKYFHEQRQKHPQTLG